MSFRKKLFIFLIAPIFLLGVFFFKDAEYYLSFSEQVSDPNILIVEGWLDYKNYYLIVEEFKNNKYNYLVTTGYESSDEFRMGQNGYLSFTPSDSVLITKNDSISVLLRGSMVNDLPSKFYFEINNFISDTFKTYINPKYYNYKIDSSFYITQVKIWFINDAVKGKTDRDLFVNELVIPNYKLSVKNKKVYYRPLPRLLNDSVFMGKTYSESCAINLINKGIPTEKIIQSPFYQIKFKSKTLTSAISCKELLSDKIHDSLRINIISQGIHCRRTYRAYKKVFGKNVTIGIIDLNKKRETQQVKNKYMAIELIKLLYTCLIPV